MDPRRAPEAQLYEPAPAGAVRCLACERRCVIPDGSHGQCRVRVARAGKLTLPAWGRLGGLNLSPIEVKPFYHFHPGTLHLSAGSIGCNFRCPGCQNWTTAHATLADLEEEPPMEPERLAELARKTAAHGLSFTYNEPTVWVEYMARASARARALGLLTTLVTNGYFTRQALALIAPSLDAVRIDVKAFSPRSYARVANIRDFEPVLRNAREAKRLGIHVEIVTNVVPGITDGAAELAGLAQWIASDLGPDTPWHVTRFEPHLELAALPRTPVATLECARASGLAAGLHFVYIGNVPGHPAEHTYCPRCSLAVIERVSFGVSRVRLAPDNRCPGCGESIPIVGKARETPGDRLGPVRVVR